MGHPALVAGEQAGLIRRGNGGQALQQAVFEKSGMARQNFLERPGGPLAPEQDIGQGPPLDKKCPQAFEAIALTICFGWLSPLQLQLLARSQHFAHGIEVSAYRRNRSQDKEVQRKPTMAGKEIKQVDAESSAIDTVVMVAVIDDGPEKSTAGEEIVKRFARTPEQGKT